MIVTIPVSVGELIDKITILAIKSRKMPDNEDVKNELSKLIGIRDHRLTWSLVARDIDLMRGLTEDLGIVNQDLWDVYDRIRELHRLDNHGDEFVHQACQVFKLNTERGDLKRKVNELFGSEIVEVKQYKSFTPGEMLEEGGK
jgi:hypothetical protein